MNNDQISPKTYAPGKHLLLDFWGAKNLSNLKLIKNALIDAAKSCNATILDTKMHSFGSEKGVTGVVILAESHISIHTWPETEFCAIDVFMCGDCDAENAIEPLKKLFDPAKVKIQRYLRG